MDGDCIGITSSLLPHFTYLMYLCVLIMHKSVVIALLQNHQLLQMHFHPQVSHFTIQGISLGGDLVRRYFTLGGSPFGGDDRGGLRGRTYVALFISEKLMRLMRGYRSLPLGRAIHPAMRMRTVASDNICNESFLSQTIVSSWSRTF
jgi:hypothetical protein